MSGKRLVEYFLVAGVDKKKASSSSTDGGMPSVSSSPLSPLSLLSEHAGSARGKFAVGMTPRAAWLLPRCIWLACRLSYDACHYLTVGYMSWSSPGHYPVVL